jgi:hypothetical protein
MLLQFPYLLSADKGRLAELSVKKGKTDKILVLFSNALFYNLSAIRINPK